MERYKRQNKRHTKMRRVKALGFVRHCKRLTIAVHSSSMSQSHLAFAVLSSGDLSVAGELWQFPDAFEKHLGIYD